MNRRLILALTLIAVALFATQTRADDDYYCWEPVGEMTIYANVIVPYGAVCELSGTTIEGNIFVEQGGALATYEAYLEGNIQAEGTWGTPMGDMEMPVPNRICGGQVYGDIQLKYNSAPFAVGCGEGMGNFVDGNVQIENNEISNPDMLEVALAVSHNTINGDLQLYWNTADYGEIRVCANMIFGNLQCEYNDPMPFGENNTVYGDAEGQCYGFDGAMGGHDDDDSHDDDMDDDSYDDDSYDEGRFFVTHEVRHDSKPASNGHVAFAPSK